MKIPVGRRLRDIGPESSRLHLGVPPSRQFGDDGRVPRPTCRAGAVVPVLAAPLTAGEQTTQRITPNFKDADITQIAEAVSAATGKNFIIDPRVGAQGTMLSSTPMSPAAFYEAFLSILQVYGFIAVPSGNVVKILPNANARQMA